MRLVIVGIGLIALAIVTFVCLAVYYPARRDASPEQHVAVVSRGFDGRDARLAGQVEEMQRSLDALKARMRAEAGGRVVPTSDTKSAESLTVEEQRAQDRERLRTYMTGVEQAFANEKVDAAWASGASSRVGSTFDGDDVLKGVARTVECRAQTCRVQIEDDGSGRLQTRMPFVAIGLADVLPSISAEHIEQGNGRGAMVLYLSSQRNGPLTPK